MKVLSAICCTMKVVLLLAFMLTLVMATVNPRGHRQDIKGVVTTGSEGFSRKIAKQVQYA